MAALVGGGLLTLERTIGDVHDVDLGVGLTIGTVAAESIATRGGHPGRSRGYRADAIRAIDAQTGIVAQRTEQGAPSATAFLRFLDLALRSAS